MMRLFLYHKQPEAMNSGIDQPQHWSRQVAINSGNVKQYLLVTIDGVVVLCLKGTITVVTLPTCN
jgi:hypothetical protein